MKIQYMSDLHLEFGSKQKVMVHPEADVLVLAGDIHTRSDSLPKFFRKLRIQKEIPIIYILGNHEYYGHSFSKETLRSYYDVCVDCGVNLLEQGSIVINNVRLVGCTMHTKLNPECSFAVKEGLSDFSVVGGMTIDAWNDKFIESRTFLGETLAIEHEGPTIVVTHFVPLFINDLIQPEFQGSRTNAGFVTDMSDLILDYQPDVWIFGHNHYNKDFNLEKTRLVTNQIGYRSENLTYQECAIVEV